MLKLSIITVCYNNLEGLKRTYESIISQTARKEFEWIIVDGNSSDGTKDFLEAHTDDIDKWVSEPDSGIYNAMNKGARFSRGEYCLFINSGDKLRDRKVIESCLPELDGTGLLYGDEVSFNPATNEYGGRILPEKLTPCHFYRSTLCHPSTFIRRQLLIDNPYSEKYRIVSDWLFFAQEIINHNVTSRKIKPKVSVFYRDGVSVENVKSTEDEQQRALGENFPASLVSDMAELFYYRQMPFTGINYKLKPLVPLYRKVKAIFKKNQK